MKTMREQMSGVEDWAREFVNAGGNEALFWAGRMSQAAEAVANCSVLSLSDCVTWLDMVRQKYDNVIMEMTVNKPKA